MPKVSRDSAPRRQDAGPVVDLRDELDGYTVSFTTAGRQQPVGPELDRRDDLGAHGQRPRGVRRISAGRGQPPSLGRGSARRPV
jgi:hypothetical protein